MISLSLMAFVFCLRRSLLPQILMSFFFPSISLVLFVCLQNYLEFIFLNSALFYKWRSSQRPDHFNDCIYIPLAVTYFVFTASGTYRHSVKIYHMS